MMTLATWAVLAMYFSPCFGYVDMPNPLPGTNIYQLRMQGAVPQNDDDYVCTAYKLDSEKEMYITQFKVEGTAERAHHMLIFGCGEIPPEAANPYWNCQNHGVCSASSGMLYGWAKNAAGTRLPPSVGFRIGDKSKAKYLVIQVHYATKLPQGELDYSGVDLEITSKPQRYIAGIVPMFGFPDIPPFQAVVNADACCPLAMENPIHVFAARVHAHGLGKVITAYKHDKKTGVVEQMIKGNPQWPQSFYPTTTEFIMESGDWIMARCSYSSLGKSTHTYTGFSGSDEMCNVYLMYYTEASPTGEEIRPSCGHVACNRTFPADSEVPLPPNPVLEAYAIHGKKHQEVTESKTNVAIPEVINQHRKGAQETIYSKMDDPKQQLPHDSSDQEKQKHESYHTLGYKKEILKEENYKNQVHQQGSEQRKKENFSFWPLIFWDLFLK